MEPIGNAKLIIILIVKTIHEGTMIIKLVVKYCYGKMVSSANQKVVMTVNHGQSHQFIQMEQLGLNTEPNQKGLISGELHHFSSKKIRMIKHY